MNIIYILLTLLAALAIVGFLAATDHLRDRAEDRRYERRAAYDRWLAARAATTHSDLPS